MWLILNKILFFIRIIIKLMTYRQPTINFQSSSGPVASAAPIGQPTTSYMVADPNPSYAEFGKKSIVHDGYQSVLVKDNTHYQNTEKLYRPLKDTLSHPQWSREHAQYAPEVSQTSQVSKRYRRLDTKEISNIVNYFLLSNKIPTFLMLSLFPPEILTE